MFRNICVYGGLFHTHSICIWHDNDANLKGEFIFNSIAYKKW